MRRNNLAAVGFAHRYVSPKGKARPKAKDGNVQIVSQ